MTDLLRAELARALTETRRYWVEPVLGTALLAMVFAGLLHGGSALGVMAPRHPHGLVLGFFAWSLAATAYGAVASDIARESVLGTLEQLVLTPHRLVVVFAVRACVQMALGLAMSSLLLLATMAIAHRWLILRPTAVLALLLGLPGLFGVGLAIGGLALLIKRVTALVALTHLLLIGVIALEPEPFSAAGALPFAAAAAIASRATTSTAAVPPADFAWLAFISLGYLAAGFAVFGAAERRARAHNLLEQH